METSYLLLEDKTVLKGLSPAWQKRPYPGEVVFNTGMTGYEQALTDPSYCGQILVFTYPLIGNYGVGPAETWESKKIHAAGVVLSEAAPFWSHHKGKIGLSDWLEEQKISLIQGIDTRELTIKLRSKGTMAGVISPAKTAPKKLFDIKIPMVSIRHSKLYNPGGTKLIILVDCGLKLGILRFLTSMGYKVKRVPFDYDYTTESYDAVVISNGPGDPMDYLSTIKITKKALSGNRPVFGICLGSQIMGLAAGARTYKLLYGHRGHNQPCQDIGDNKCYLTSQNHSYAVDEKTLPKSWKVSFRNLNDGSVEGIRHVSKPFFAVQFHPEASPGPTDTTWLFNQLLAKV